MSVIIVDIYTVYVCIRYYDTYTAITHVLVVCCDEVTVEGGTLDSSWYKGTYVKMAETSGGKAAYSCTATGKYLYYETYVIFPKFVFMSMLKRDCLSFESTPM